MYREACLQKKNETILGPLKVIAYVPIACIKAK